MRSFLYFTVVAAFCLTAACASKNPADVSSASETHSGTPAMEDGDTQFRLSPNDEVTVMVWRNADLERTARIDPSGYIDLPLAGRIKAAGLTPPGERTEFRVFRRAETGVRLAVLRLRLTTPLSPIITYAS